MGTSTQNRHILTGIVIMVLLLYAFIDTNYQSEKAFAYMQQSGEFIRISDGLMDACLQSGFSYGYCNNILYSKNPGGYCDYLSSANLGCPQIQDPSFTYNNPGQAMQESQNKINQLDNLIQQWDYLYPPGWSR
jgi:hypothetical protein